MIDNVTNHATVKSMYDAGGIVGFAESGDITMTNCVNTGTIEVFLTQGNGGTKVGGIIGYAEVTSITITNAINQGELHSSHFMGGQEAYAGGIIGVIKSPNSKIENCQNSGKVNGTSKNVMVACGGICGFDNSEKTFNDQHSEQW